MKNKVEEMRKKAMQLLRQAREIEKREKVERAIMIAQIVDEYVEEHPESEFAKIIAEKNYKTKGGK